MKIYKAYKFRLYPNKEQQEIINKTLGSTRFVYNHYLSKKTKTYNETKTTLKTNDCIKDLPNLYKENPWLKEIDSLSLRTTLFDLEDSYKRFFNKQANYPKYKNKYQKNSYRTNCIKSSYKGKEYQNIKVDMNNHTITLPKLKNIKIKGYRKTKEIKGRIINATISREINRYYVSVLYEQEITTTKATPKTIIGIDLGVKDLVITNYGEKLTNEKHIKKYENKIKNLQKWLSKKQRGSKNYYKIKKKLQIAYRKLKNARKYSIHYITKKLTEENDIIVSEKLQIKSMLTNKTTNKYILDASLSEIIRQLEYKSKWKNKKYYQIETYYPSSQICSNCNEKNKETKNLNIRNWTCPKCNYTHDRDINAAINIMDKGLEIYIKELTKEQILI